MVLFVCMCNCPKCHYSSYRGHYNHRSSTVCCWKLVRASINSCKLSHRYFITYNFSISFAFLILFAFHSFFFNSSLCGVVVVISLLHLSSELHAFEMRFLFHFVLRWKLVGLTTAAVFSLLPKVIVHYLNLIHVNIDHCDLYEFNRSNERLLLWNRE